MDYYHVDDKYCRAEDGGHEYWRGMDNYVTFNFGFSPLTQYNYYYYYNSYEDWLQTASIELHLKCSDGSKLIGLEPTSTPAPATVEPETTNTFFVNGLDQEYLINFHDEFLNKTIRSIIWVFRRDLNGGILNVRIANL